MSEDQAAAATDGAQTQVTETAEAATLPPTALAASKATKSGDLIADIAHEIETMTKVKALNRAEKLAEDIEANYFKLGGLLKLILAQQWFEGFPSFGAFVLEKFGFAERKAHYLISIYTQLVDKQIPWEKVQHLGWTKLKDLAAVLTPENVDDWVAKAEKVSVAELQAMLKGTGGNEGGEPSSAGTSDVVSWKVKLHKDQHESVNMALAKAKGEMQTDHDNVALAAICTGYLANSSGVVASGPAADPVETFKSMGYEAVLGVFEQSFPNIDLEVTVKAA